MVPRARILLIVAIFTSAVATAAAAPAAVFIAVTPHVVYQGQKVRVHGNAGSCPVGDTVTLISRAFSKLHEFAGIPAVLTKVRSGGAFHVTTRIPLHRHSGLYGIVARCGGGNLGVAANLRVLKH